MVLKIIGLSMLKALENTLVYQPAGTQISRLAYDTET